MQRFEVSHGLTAWLALSVPDRTIDEHDPTQVMEIRTILFEALSKAMQTTGTFPQLTTPRPGGKKSGGKKGGRKGC